MTQIILSSSTLFNLLRPVLSPTRLTLLVNEINRSPSLVRDLQQLEALDNPLNLNGGGGQFNPGTNVIGVPDTAARSISDKYAVEAFLGEVIHEVGHFVNRAADALLWISSKDAQDTYQSCFATEGRAILYSATVIGESRANGSSYTIQNRWGDNSTGNNATSNAAIFRATESVDRQYPNLTSDQREYAIATLVGYQYGISARPTNTGLGDFTSYVGFCAASAQKRFPANTDLISVVPGPIRPGIILDDFDTGKSEFEFDSDTSFKIASASVDPEIGLIFNVIEFGGSSVSFSTAFNDNRNITLTGITSVNGLPPVDTSSTITNAALAEARLDVRDIQTDPARVVPYVEAVDATNPEGTTPSLVELTGQTDWWNSPNLHLPEVRATLGDFSSLLAMLKSKDPVVIASDLTGFLSHKTNNPALTSIATGLSLLKNLKGLDDAFKTGSAGRALAGGVGAYKDALTIYTTVLEQQIIGEFGSVFAARIAIDQGDEIAVALIGKFDGAAGLLSNVAQGLPYLNIIVNALEGDIEGVLKAAIIAYYTKADPLTATILTCIDVAYSLLKHERQFEANGRFVGGANGEITVQVDNANGGAYPVFVERMSLYLEQTRKQAELVSGFTKQPMGLIAERLPTLEFKRDTLFLRYQDPLSGHSFAVPQTAEAAYISIIIANYLYKTWENSIFAPQTAIAANDGAWEVAA